MRVRACVRACVRLTDDGAQGKRKRTKKQKKKKNINGQSKDGQS